MLPLLMHLNIHLCFKYFRQFYFHKLTFYCVNTSYPMDNKLISTQDSCKYIYFNNWLQNVPTHYRLNSLVQLLQQLVTVYRQGTGYTALYTCFHNWCQSVLTGTDYTALYTCLNNWLQSVPAGTGYTALYTCFNYWLQSVPAGPAPPRLPKSRNGVSLDPTGSLTKISVPPASGHWSGLVTMI